MIARKIGNTIENVNRAQPNNELKFSTEEYYVPKRRSYSDNYPIILKTR